MREEILRQVSEAKRIGDFSRVKMLQLRLIEIDKVSKQSKIPKVTTP